MTYRAFSLAEVLLCLAIAAVAGTLTLIGLSYWRESAAQRTCAQHLRTIHQATMIYRMDFGGDLGAAGNLYAMNYPPDVLSADRKSVLIGSRGDWLCPAPKRKAFDYWPHYEYVLMNANAWDKNGDYLASAARKYGSALPLVSDLNHNDHGAVDIYAPRVRKRVLYVAVGGTFVSKYVHRAFDVAGWLEAYEISEE